MADTFSAFCPATSSVLIFTSPIEPNSVKAGFPLPSSSPASLASLLLTRVMGAPVSKTSLYGPLPFTFTWTAMCPDLSSSNGTVTGFALAGASSASTGAGSRQKTSTRIFFMSDTLPAGEGDVFFLPGAFDGELDRFAGADLAGQAEDVVHVGDAASVELRQLVADGQARLAGRARGEDVLDDRVLSSLVGQREAEEAADAHGGGGRFPQETAQHLHD